MKTLHIVAFSLLLLGGLNWLLLGAFNWEVGQQLLGGQNAVASRVVYVLVGLAALVELANHKAGCKNCEVESKASSSPTPPTVSTQ